jgi:hypothetical protein
MLWKDYLQTNTIELEKGAERLHTHYLPQLKHKVRDHQDVVKVFENFQVVLHVFHIRESGQVEGKIDKGSA